MGLNPVKQNGGQTGRRFFCVPPSTLRLHPSGDWTPWPDSLLMTAMTVLRSPLLLALAWLALLGGAAPVPRTGLPSFKPPHLAQLQKELVTQKGSAYPCRLCMP